MKTLKDYFGDATRSEGKRFRKKDSKKTWFEPIFKDNCGFWHGLDDSDSLTDNSDYWSENTECEPYVEPKKTETRWLWATADGKISSEFEPYVEPKKTETRWLWATADGKISSEFSTAPLSSYSQRAPLDSPKFDVKLEWSATQFDVGG